MSSLFAGISLQEPIGINTIFVPKIVALTRGCHSHNFCTTICDCNQSKFNSQIEIFAIFNSRATISLMFGRKTESTDSIFIIESYIIILKYYSWYNSKGLLYGVFITLLRSSDASLKLAKRVTLNG